MAQDDPFTIDLFGNTALSSGLGLGVTAFAADLDGDDYDGDPPPSAPAPAGPALAPVRARAPRTRTRGNNFHLAGDRGLANGWKQRARDSVAAIRLAVRIEAEQRPASPDEQRQLMRFTGFGASELANGVFRRPGESEFAKGWEEIGVDLKDAIDDAGYASLARCSSSAGCTSSTPGRVHSAMSRPNLSCSPPANTSR
jgi:adenine-specific DNA methylase